MSALLYHSCLQHNLQSFIVRLGLLYTHNYQMNCAPFQLKLGRLLTGPVWNLGENADVAKVSTGSFRGLFGSGGYNDRVVVT